MTVSRALTGMRVGHFSLPPWDREGRSSTDLSGRQGEHVAVTLGNAARLLGADRAMLPRFVRPGIIRVGTITERPYVRDAITHACATPDYWTRIHLRHDEALREVALDDPEGWMLDTAGRDCEGRICVRIRPRAAGQTGDMTIVTDRRRYRVRLVAHPTKVTLSLNWTYPEGAGTTPHGRPFAPPGATKRPTETQARATLFYLFELGRSLRDLFRDWASALEPTRAWQVQAYRRLRTSASIPSDEPHPTAIVEFVLSRIIQTEGFSDAEVRQYLTLPRTGVQAMVDMLRGMALGRRVTRLPLPAGVSPTVEDMLDPFPFLAGLPGTCYHDDDLHQAPPERARRIVWSMGPAAEHAALFITIGNLFLRRPVVISETVGRLATLERIAAEAGIVLRLDDPMALRAAIEHVLSSPDCAHMGQNVRHEIARCTRLVASLLRKYIRLHDPKDVRGLGRLMPTDPAAMRDLTAKIVAVRLEVAQAGRDSRKARVHAQAGRLASLEFAADLNLEQVVTCNRALTAAGESLGDSPWIDIPVPLTIVDGRGRLRPGKQSCVWRIWNARAYLVQLLRGDWSVKERARIQGRIDAIDAGGAMAPVREYRRVEGLLGSNPVEPFFVRCWRFGLMARPGSLPVRLLPKRHAVMRELRLPGHTRCSTGLMEGTAEEMDLWRMSLQRGRTIAFLDPFEHALRFGHLALSSVSENMSRTTAWMQQVQDQSGWRVRRLNRQPVAGFLAHDKLSPHGDIPDQRSWFPVGPKHQAEMAELVEMTCRRCGYADGLLPEILHLEKYRWKCPEPQAWVFSYGGSMNKTGDMARFLRFLLPSVGRLTYHDFRHLIANAAFEAGVPGWMIRLGLNHGFTEMWLYYAELSRKQTQRLDELSVQGTIARSADARALAAA